LFGRTGGQPSTVWKKLDILFRIGGNLSEDAVKHAIALSAEKILFRRGNPAKDRHAYVEA